MTKVSENVEGPTVEVLGSPNSTVLTPTVSETLATAKGKDFKEMFEKVGRISVKPFLDGNQENMGLENYNMSVFPGTYHEEQLAAIERNGVIRFITGLDEFAPEVQNITDEEQKAALILNIRNVVAHLEKMLATNVIEVDDPDFWNKVQLLKPNNIEFWGGITLRCGNDALYLNPAKDGYDLIKMMAIEAGGFDIISKSFEDAQAQSVPPKFYLDKEVHTVSSRTTYKKLRNQAIGILDKLSDKNFKKLLYITKVIDSNSVTYKNSTPGDVLYDVLDEYINGNGVETNKTKAAQNFIDVSKSDMETLKLKAIVKDASFYKIIAVKADGMIYHSATGTMLGRNVSDVVMYFKNPINEDVLSKTMVEVENYWNN